MISKAKFLVALIQQIDNQANDLREELRGLDLEIANETKSSAGDKFETSREMMSQSRQAISSRADVLKEQVYFLRKVQASSPMKKVSAGSLIETNEGYFFFGLALGNLTFKKTQIVALSFQSPLGKAFLDKKVGNQVHFRDRTFTILNCR